jgi:hypothetical protein
MRRFVSPIVAAITIALVPAQPASAKFHTPIAIHRVIHKHAPVPVKPKPVKPKPPKKPVYAYGVTPLDVQQWSRVNICEEGGNWHIRGSMYSGGLGISNTNWLYYSRGMGLPYSAADATPIQQIAVAKKINAGYSVPDQNGCAAW